MYSCIYAVVREDDDVCWLEPRCRCCGIDPPLTTTFCHGSNEIFNPKTVLRHGQFSFRNGQVILPLRAIAVSTIPYDHALLSLKYGSVVHLRLWYFLVVLLIICQ